MGNKARASGTQKQKPGLMLTLMQRERHGFNPLQEGCRRFLEQGDELSERNHFTDNDLVLSPSCIYSIRCFLKYEILFSFFKRFYSRQREGKTNRCLKEGI